MQYFTLQLFILHTVRVAGNVLSHEVSPCPVALEVAVRLRVFEGVMPILIGSPLTLYAHRCDMSSALSCVASLLFARLTLFFSMSQPVVVAKLRALLDPNTGAVTQKNPRCAAPNSIALVVLQVCRARVCSFCNCVWP